MKGLCPWNKGKTGIYSEETLKKMRNSKLGKHFSSSTEFKKGDVNAFSGRKHTEETKNKISIANNGRKKSKEEVEQIRKRMTGNRNPIWKGGISKIDMKCRHMPEYKQWRSDVFQRDRWTCKTCGANGCYVTAHHIKGFSLIIMENKIKNIEEARACDELWDISNGITLCEECHSLTDNYKGRSKN